jgi:hypothetical protein
MKMLGHQNPADQQEMPFLPHLVKPLHKAAPQSIRKEKWRTAIGAGGDELELTGTNAGLTRSLKGMAQESILSTVRGRKRTSLRDHGLPKPGACASPAKTTGPLLLAQ